MLTINRTREEVETDNLPLANLRPGSRLTVQSRVSQMQFAVTHIDVDAEGRADVLATVIDKGPHLDCQVGEVVQIMGACLRKFGWNRRSIRRGWRLGIRRQDNSCFHLTALEHVWVNGQAGQIF